MVSVTEFVTAQQVASIGIIIGVILSLSPIPTFIDIAMHSKTTGGYTVAPYLSALVCCSCWLTYALLAGASKADLIPLNAASFIIYSIYCGVFLRFCENRAHVLRLYSAALVVVALTLTTALVFKSLIVIGLLATIANCIMFAAPLAVMQQVIQTRSVRYMPFLLSFMSFICASVWLVWASLVGDYFVLVPNALGTFFGVVQLLLYTVYWRLSTSETVEGIQERVNLDPRIPPSQGIYNPTE
jgi:solute carrier family 50 protein (sugar transporter)